MRIKYGRNVLGFTLNVVILYFHLILITSEGISHQGLMKRRNAGFIPLVQEQILKRAIINKIAQHTLQLRPVMILWQ